MRPQKKKRKNLFDDKRFLVIFAFALALLSWVIIAGFINPGQDNTINNVPVNYHNNEGYFKNQDLMIVKSGSANVSVKISGNGGTIFSLTNSDIAIYPDYTSVNGPGTYELNLKWEKIAAGNYEVVEISPKTVKVQLEKMVTRTFTVAAKADGVEAAANLFPGAPVAAPQQVEVTGPESLLEKVDKAVANVQIEEVLEKTKIYSGANVTLLDAAGEEISSELITISPSELEVTVPIFEVREIPVEVSFVGVPANFDEEWLRGLMTLSTETIRVSGEPSQLNNLQAYTLEPIDLSTFKLGEKYTRAVSLDSRFTNYDNISQIEISFDTSGLAQKSFNVTNIKIVNIPLGLTIEPLDNVVLNVTVIGPAEEIDDLLPENLQVQVDAIDVSAVEGGQQQINARVLIPSSNRIFAVESYKVLCEVSIE